MSMTNKLAASICAAALSLTCSPGPAWAGDLNQVVTADEPVAPADTLVEFNHGHADLGPLLAPESPDKFDVMVRDDTATPPTWRSLDDVIFVVNDDAIQTLPETQDFDFVGAQPGAKVWVAPQVEQVGVPWLGWSTQSPAFVEAAQRGVTMTFLGHEGPGQFTLFLQNGGFEKPQVLWSSAVEGAQDLWIDVNTHTHANWVFTQPGIHNVAVKMSAEFKDGSTHSVTKTLTFAVGQGVDLTQAQAAQWEGDFLPETEDDAAITADAPSANTAETSSTQWVLWAIIALVGVLVVGSLFAVFRALGSRGSRKDS